MRVAKSNVHEALAQVAQKLIDAGGEDGRISRADVAAQLDNLSGTERDLADIFFRFIDHRDHKPGATVTAKDVHRALEYSKEKLIDKYDLNSNGLSKSEIKEMSYTGRLAVQLAQEIKATAQSSDGLSGEALSKLAEAKAEGLLFMSEGDEPYTAFHLQGDGNWDVESFRDAMGIAPDMEISQESFDEFFADPSVYGEPGTEEHKQEMAQYEDVAQTLRDNLTDLQVLWVGGDDVVQGQIYMVGTAQDGSLAGLETTRIWT